MNVAASTGIGGRVMQYAHLSWMLVVAAIAVVVGFSTLNMMLADSGLAVLNEHAAPFMTLFARLTRQA
jgi:hypothetical protein